jgi:hypothetical protein
MTIKASCAHANGITTENCVSSHNQDSAEYEHVIGSFYQSQLNESYQPFVNVYKNAFMFCEFYTFYFFI